MITHAEQLPIEIWLTIFRYLETHDLFQAFEQLNSYFDQILSSNHLSFYLHLRENDKNHFQHPENPYWSDVILKRVIYLQSSSPSEYDCFSQFLRWHAKKLSRLQSLSIKIYRRNIPYICIALKELNRLEYLFIKCIPNQILLETILALPNLRICQLFLREIVIDVGYHSGIKSNIKRLSISFYHSINHSIINLLLMHMPKLQQLEISGSYYKSDKVSLFTEQLFLLPELRILKLKLENGCFTYDCFKCLSNIMPFLKYLYFNYYNHYLHEQFFEDFITRWWIIIERIERIDISIEGHIFTDTNNDNTESTLKHYRESLLAKNNRSEERVQIEWTEQILIGFKIVEINIVKS